jgi:hypothetical protein
MTSTIFLLRKRIFFVYLQGFQRRKPKNITYMNKKTLLCFVALVSLSSWADPIDRNRAKEIASGYLAIPGAEPQLVVSSNGARLVSGVSEQKSPLYIFSRGENAGFVIVSGDDCLPEVLGYTESGNFVESEMPPALIEWLNGYATLIQQAQEAGAPSRTLTRSNAARVSSSWTDISPLVPTHWHQSSPYNDACPRRASDPNSRCATGCVATAAAQVLYYWRKDCNRYSQRDTPSYKFEYSGCDMENTENVKITKGTPFLWELMKESYSGSESAEYKNAVAVLVACVGMTNYLGYGSSTAGQTGDLVGTFSSQFGLTAKYTGKGSDLSTWESTIYNELLNKRPIVYSGVSETSGGHAVVLDGYRASGTAHFHFNFGWGGQGDGYYTVDDETGMNGFNSGQAMVYQIQPSKNNLSAYLLDDDFYTGASNKIRVKVTNNGTLDYDGGFMLYASATSEMGTARETLKDVVPEGESRILTFEYNPALEKEYRIQIRDSKGNILISDKRTAVENKPNLSVSTCTFQASSDTETEAGITYPLVYNNQVTVRATVRNNGTAPCTPTFKFELLQYSKKTGELIKKQTGSLTKTYDFEPDKETVVEYTFKSLKDTINYAVRVQPNYMVSTKTYSFEMQDTNYIYFRAPGKDLEVSGVENGTATFSGHWDATLFTTSMSKLSDVNNVDLTAVSGVGEVPTLATSPNLLIWCDGKSEASGNNVIKNGVCNLLSLTKGYDFSPKEAFTAKTAIFHHALDSAGIYSTLVLPFDANTPSHLTARRIETHTTNALKTATVVSELKANTPYIYITDTRDAEDTQIYAHQVSIAATPGDPDTACDDIMKGTWTRTTTPTDRCFLLDDQETQHFTKVDQGTEVPALTAYIQNDATTLKTINFSINTYDKYMKQLAAAVAEGYDALTQYYSMRGTESYMKLDSAVTNGDSIVKAFNESSSSTSRSLTKSITSYIAELSAQYTGEWDGTDNPWGEEVTTRYILNPSFESGSASNITGWTKHPEVNGVISSNSSAAYFTVGVDGEKLFYAKNSIEGEAILSQSLPLPTGRYRLSAKVNTEEGSTVTVTLGEVSVTVNASDLGEHYFADAVIEEFDQEEDTEVTLSFKTSDGQWLRADDVRLYRLVGNDKTAIILGDANGDGKVSVEDITVVAAYLMDNSANTIDLNAADANKDGIISVADITTIAAIILGGE